MTRPTLTIGLWALCLCLAPPTSARPRSSDGAYGRLDGDLAVALDAGMGLRNSDSAFIATACARYLQTAGLYSTWHVVLPRNADATTLLSLGVELRPLFLPRFLTNRELGPAWFDLAVDSVALRVGTLVASAPVYSWTRPGFETSIGAGLPLTRRAAGPWLGSMVSVQLSPNSLATQPHQPSATAVMFAITLGWQAIFPAHVVDAADRQAL